MDFANLCRGLSPSAVKDPDLLAFVLTRCTDAPPVQTRTPEASIPTPHIISKRTDGKEGMAIGFDFEAYEDIENACNTDVHLRSISDFTACGNQPLTLRHMEINEFLHKANEADVRHLLKFYEALGLFNKKRLREFLSHNSASRDEIRLKESAFQGVQTGMLDATQRLLSKEITWKQFNELRATAREMSYNLLAHPLPSSQFTPNRVER